MGHARRTLFFTDCTAVFQGGGCRGAAHAGAYQAATEAGVGVAGVAGASAGSIMAALVGAGATARQTSEIIRALDFNKLLRPPSGKASQPIANALLTPFLLGRLKAARTVWFYGGQYSTSGLEEWVDECLATLLPKSARPVRFRDLILPTWVVATDLRTRDAKVWSKGTDDNEPVAHTVAASCAIPGFFQPVDGRYVDGGVISNLPAFVVSPEERNAPRRVLAFTLRESTAPPAIEGPTDIFAAVADAVVKGGQSVQMGLQANTVHEIRIDTGDIKATDFARMNTGVVDSLFESGHSAASDFFRAEGIEVLPSPYEPTTPHALATNNKIASLLLSAVRRVAISSANSKWVFELFPALLVARRKSVAIDVVLAPNTVGNANEAYRRRLLKRMGVRVVETTDLPVTYWLADPDEQFRTEAIIIVDRPSLHATSYVASQGHEAVLRLLHQDFMRRFGGPTDEVPGRPPSLQPASDQEVISRLRNVAQYAHPDVKLSIQNVPLTHVTTFARYAPAFKHLQAQASSRMLRDAGLPPYGPAVVDLGTGPGSLIVPPVFEESGDRFVLINGTSRCLVAHREGSASVIGVVARNVSAEPPARNPRPIANVPVDIGLPGTNDRFDGFEYGNFRKIEESVHTMESMGSEDLGS